MKNFMSTKIKIVLLVLFILSILCYTFAAINLYNSNYSLSSYFSNITKWPHINDWHLGWGNYDKHSSGDIKKDFPNTIENININTTASDIYISTHDDPTILMNINGDFDSNHEYNDCIKKFNVTDKDVTIETTNKTFFNGVSLNICIPSNFKGSLTIKTISGDIDASDLTLSNLSLTSTSGDVKAYNINSANSNLSSISGEIKTNGSLGECTISSTSGDIELNLSDLGNNSTITSTSGDVNVILADTIGYKANLSSSSGDIETNNENNITKNYNFTNGDGAKNISVHTTSGDICVN